MDENTGNNKVLGLQSAQYVKVCYALVLIAGALGLLLALLGGIGLGTGTGSWLLTIMGLSGLIMSLIGWVAFPKEFTVIEISHLRYVSLVFVVFYVLSIALASILPATGFIWFIIAMLMGTAQILLLYLGFRVWLARHEATQDSIKAEFEALKSYLKNRSNI